MTSNGAVIVDATVPAMPPAKKLAGNPSLLTTNKGMALNILSGLHTVELLPDFSASQTISKDPTLLFERCPLFFLRR